MHRFYGDSLAQLVEHIPFKDGVVGSNPTRITTKTASTIACGLSFYPHTTPTIKSRISGKFVGINYALLPNCEWNKKQKHKKQSWSNVECFAFGGATVRFASLETNFLAANHTIPPPPSYEGYPLCPKDKNHSPSAKNP